PQQQVTTTRFQVDAAQLQALSALEARLGPDFFRRHRSSAWDPVVSDPVMQVLTPEQRALLLSLEVRPEQSARLFQTSPAQAARAAWQPPPEDPVYREGHALVMELARVFLRQAREDRLEELVPTPAQRQQLATGVARGMRALVSEDEARSLAHEAYRVLQLTPEQERRMKGFSLTREQGVGLIERMLDLAPELMARNGSTREDTLAWLAPRLQGLLTPDQMEVLADLDLSPEQQRRLEELLVSRGLPFLDGMRGRFEQSGESFPSLRLNDEQGQWVERILRVLMSR
ncbi:MAG: hypothetical protein AB1758_24600, partial [Candidatus Eremiobacterota bacterium]